MFTIDKKTSVVFDDYTVKDSDGDNCPYWTQVCSTCSDKFADSYLDETGQGICGVVGCNNESSYYYDFDAYQYSESNSTLKLVILLKAWMAFGNIPLSDDEIDAPFLHFEKGTSVEDIFSWFEHEHPSICVGKLINGSSLDVGALDTFIRRYCYKQEKMGNKLIMRGVIRGWSNLELPASFRELEGMDCGEDSRAWISLGCLAIITYHNGGVNVVIHNSLEEFVNALESINLFYTKGD